MKRTHDTINHDSEQEDVRPTPADFYARTNTARRSLTENDQKRNAGVDHLFQVITPGLPIDTDPSETRTEASALAAPIDAILKRLKINANPWLEELAAAWTTIFPPEISSCTAPGKWDQGILYIYVTSSIRLFELRRTKWKYIEETIRTFAGDRIRIRQVRLMVNAAPLSAP